MAIQANFPALKPSLLLDFANTKQLDARITYTRASTATYYDGVTTAKAEENLVLQSQTFDTTWSVFNTSVTSNTDTAPDGTTTADTVTDSTAANIHILQQAMSGLLANTSYTVSCYLKKGTNNYAALTLTQNSGSGVWITAVFDLNAGTVSQTANGASGTLSASSITSVGNGWYRCVITGTTTSAPNYVWISTVPAASGNTFGTTGAVSYTGTGTTIIAWGAQLEQRSAVTAYTATTTQAITNYIPVLQTAASGVARFDNNPTTGESLGLLIEESRTNLVTYSSEFDNAVWSIVNVTVSANAAVAPDGTLTADRLISAVTTNLTYARQLATLSAGSATWSVYVKQYGVQYLQLFWGATFNATDYVNFDITNGTVTAGTYTSASITNVGNGWYRCSITSTVAAGSGVYVFAAIVPTSTSTRATNYTGNGYSGAFYWGAQLEAGAFATSYIPTVASQVTRAADAASMTGTNFSSWYNQAEGTLYGEQVLGNIVQTNQPVVSVSNSTVSGAYTAVGQAVGGGSTTGSALFVVNNSSTQAYLASSSGIASVGSSLKSAAAYKVNDFAFTANAGSVGTDSLGFVPLVDRLQVGALQGIGQLNGTIKKVAYYPLRVTNAQLQALTS